MSDKVYISGLQAQAIVGVDHWQKPVPHPVAVDAVFSTNFSKASESDNLHYSLNYAVISDKIAKFIQKNNQKNFHSLGGLAGAVFEVLAEERNACTEVELKVSAPKVDIRAPVLYKMGTSNPGIYTIEGLRALTLIGVFTFERLNKQFVLLDIDLGVPSGHLNVSQVSESVHEYLEQLNFKTVEALVMLTAQWILQNFPNVESAAVHVTKPNAIVYTEGVGVSCFYRRVDFVGKDPIVLTKATETKLFDLPVELHSDFTGHHTVLIAVGSNEGNQLENINRALSLLDAHPNITVEATSSLYVSRAMYYTEQPDFYNGAFRLSVEDLSPHELLEVLKNIEYGEMSRVKEFENGPRTIDLDIILYDNVTVNTDDLIVPHKSMLERTFVLQPLCELLPPDYIHPVTAEPVHNHLSKLLATPVDPQVQKSSELVLLVPGSGGRVLKFNHNGRSPTVLMGVFNATPDLFSDGGRNFNLDASTIVTTALRLKSEGAHIIDVGGVSTRPGSSEPLCEDELARVLPVVKAIRAEPQLDSVLVSVDTYRAEVARQVLQHGADIINDISMGLFDEEIFSVVAEAGCGYIMNHTRGTPESMSKLTDYSESQGHLVESFIDEAKGLLPPLEDDAQKLISGVSRELATQMVIAGKRGVRKWQIILDPGVGFAKNLKQNLQLVRHARRFKQYAQTDLDSGMYTSFHGMSMLIGTSRKRFLGTITGQDVASDRVIATAASVVACIEQGTDIVRVHDVAEVKQAAQTADALYREVY